MAYVRLCFTPVSIIAPPPPPPPPIQFAGKISRLLNSAAKQDCFKMSYIIQTLLTSSAQTGKQFRNKLKSFSAIYFILGPKRTGSKYERNCCLLGELETAPRKYPARLDTAVSAMECSDTSAFASLECNCRFLNIWRKTLIKRGGLCCRNWPRTRSAYWQGLISSLWIRDLPE